MRRFGKEPFPVIYQDPKPDSEAAKSGMLIVINLKRLVCFKLNSFSRETV